MTPLAAIPTPSTVVDPRVGTVFHERHAPTESILARLAHCSSVRERRALQHEVVLRNLGLADSIAARYAGRGIDWDDLVQVGRVGLLKAVVGYDASKGAGFPAYATPTIAGEIKRYFRDYGWMVRPPRRLQELHTELSSLEPDLQQRLHRAPSAGELAGALGVGRESCRMRWWPGAATPPCRWMRPPAPTPACRWATVCPRTAIPTRLWSGPSGFARRWPG